LTVNEDSFVGEQWSERGCVRKGAQIFNGQGRDLFRYSWAPGSMCLCRPAKARCF